MTAPGPTTFRLAVYVDRTGKQPPAPETLRLESADAVKTAKFFAALGFTVEKQTLPDGRQYVLAKATNVQLGIFPSRTPTPAAEFSMTLIVDDAGAAATRAEAFGGSVVSALKEIPGGKKCVVASFEGHRVVVAELAAAPKPMAAAPVSPTPMNAAPSQPIAVPKPIEAPKPTPVAQPVEVARPMAVARPVEAEPEFVDAAMAAEATSTFEEDPLAIFDAPAPSRAGTTLAPPKPAALAPAPAPRKKAPSGALFAAPDEYYQANIAKDLSVREVRLLDGVKLGSRIMLVGMFLPFVVWLLVLVGTGNPVTAMAAIVVASIPANIMFIVGKCIAISNNSGVVDTTMAAISVTIDALFLIAGGLSLVAPKLAAIVGLLSMIFGIASPLLFLHFLGQVAQAVRHEKLALYSRIVMRCWLGCFGGGVVAIPLMLWEPKLGSILMVPVGLVAVAGLLLYIGLIIGFATVRYEAAPDPDMDLSRIGR